MTRDEVIDKARDLIAPVLGRDTSTQLIETVFEIEKVADVRSLRRLLQRADPFSSCGSYICDWTRPLRSFGGGPSASPR